MMRAIRLMPVGYSVLCRRWLEHDLLCRRAKRQHKGDGKACVLETEVGDETFVEVLEDAAAQASAAAASMIVCAAMPAS